MDAYQTFLDFLASATVTVPCPKCGEGRQMLRSQLLRLARRAGIPGKPDKWPCARCTRARVARENLERINVPGRKRKKYRHASRPPKSEEHRWKIAHSHLIGGHLELPFHRCPLCQLLVHGQQWHRVCVLTWKRHYWKKHGRWPKAEDGLPSPLRPDPARGPRPERRFTLNYQWLVQRKDKTRQERLSSQRGARGAISKPAVSAAIKSFVPRLPGSWDLVFSKTKTIRKGNDDRQRVAPLPKMLERLILSGERDSLVRHLLSFGMKPHDAARLTGVGPDRVRDLGGLASEPPPVAPDILRVGALVLDRQHRIVTRGDQSIKLSARQCELLARLAARPGQVVGPAELAASGSRSDGSAINLVRLSICRLRRKLGPGVVEAVCDGGYKLALEPGPAGADAENLSSGLTAVCDPSGVVG